MCYNYGVTLSLFASVKLLQCMLKREHSLRDRRDYQVLTQLKILVKLMFA